MELIVAGFHRSGTSMVTQLLHSAGLFVGHDLLGAAPSNPYGHFEDRDVVNIHNGILRDNGASWALAHPVPFFIRSERWTEMIDFCVQRQSHHPVWGFKDPRVCLFLGAWKHLLPDSRCLIVYRDPRDCASSLARRHARALLDHRGDVQTHERFFREPYLALRMWDRYNRNAIAFARAHIDECLVVRFERLSAGYPLIRAVNTRFGCEFQELSTESVFDPTAVSDSRSDPPVYCSQVLARVRETLEELEDLSRMTEVRL